MSYLDPTATERVRRLEKKRRAAGWREVRVWVPTEKDAIEIRTIAAKKRAAKRGETT